MNKNLILLLAAGAAYYFYTRKGSQSCYPQSFVGPLPPGGTYCQYQYCQFPDGTIIQAPLSAQCPSDPAHGGQSIFLATSTG